MIDALQDIFANLQAAAEAQAAFIRRLEGVTEDADESPSDLDAAFIRRPEGKPEDTDALPSDLDDDVEADIEAVDSGATKATAVAGESLEIATRIEEIAADIEAQLPAFLERRQAMAQAATESDARPGFLRSAVNKVKKRVWGWRA